MKTLLKTTPAATLASLLLLAAAPSAIAQKYWNANDGEWSDGGNWTNGTSPTAGTNIVFADREQSTNPTVNLSVTGTQGVNQLFINSGKTVNLAFEDDASLTSADVWQLNTNHSNPDLAYAPSHLNITGPATGTAIVTLHSIQFGRYIDTDGSSVTFDGPGLTVTTPSTGGSSTYIGAGSNNNLLSIKNGADVSLHGLWIGRSGASGQAYKDNRTIVDNASLTINGISGNRELNIGSMIAGDGSQDYENGMQSNSLVITNNASVTMSSTGPIRVGVADNAHSNLLSVDNGSVMRIQTSTLTVGKVATNLGGNTVHIGSGSSLRTGGTIIVNGYNSAGQNDGRNRLLIENGGTLTSSSTITIHGLLRLEDGGTMKGEKVAGGAAPMTVSIEKDGLFEAEGTGLGANVNTTINGGTLAVGMEDHTTAATLTLQSTVTFATAPGTLSLSLFDNGTADTLHLASTGKLILNNTLLSLSFEGASPQSGDAWTLFTGATGNITGAFDLSLLPTLAGDLEWDISAFNTAGQWRIAVIPEPGTVAMTALGGLLLFRTARRRLKATAA